MRRLLASQLANLGYTDVVFAEDGREALSRVKSQQFDLVLLDWHMPHFSGLEVLRTMRARGLMNVPIIMVSMEQKRQNIETALKLGATDYILKPVSPELLKNKIAAIARMNPTFAAPEKNAPESPAPDTADGSGEGPPSVASPAIEEEQAGEPEEAKGSDSSADADA